MTWLFVSIAAVSFTIAIAGTLVVRRWSRRVGFVDRPHAHKAHAVETALGGGIAITAAIVMTLLGGALLAAAFRGNPTLAPPDLAVHLDGMRSRVPTLLGIIGCVLVLHVVGILDDRRALGPAPKLLVQTLVALVTAWPMGVRLLEALPAPVSVALTVIWIVVITNAFNFLDNMDGLSAGVATIAAAVFALTAARGGQVFVPMLAMALAGAAAGFLVFNFSPASIFMGDAGSLVIGYLMAVIATLTTFYDPGQRLSPLGVMVPLVVLAVPLYDVASVVILRIRSGQSPFRGDRRHFSHRLVGGGMSARRAVVTIYLATFATALPATVLARVDGWSAALLLSQCACVVAMIAILESRSPRPS